VWKIKRTGSREGELEKEKTHLKAARNNGSSQLMKKRSASTEELKNFTHSDGYVKQGEAFQMIPFMLA